MFLQSTQTAQLIKPKINLVLYIQNRTISRTDAICYLSTSPTFGQSILVARATKAKTEKICKCLDQSVFFFLSVTIRWGPYLVHRAVRQSGRQSVSQSVSQSTAHALEYFLASLSLGCPISRHTLGQRPITES
uniref:GM10308p n=1 Tax=Drosophila melanogaster TaxID=7227 RepID=Q95S34_DROME|nr:GM10308p [Drosophila melanogaster]